MTLKFLAGLDILSLCKGQEIMTNKQTRSHGMLLKGFWQEWVKKHPNN
jgi:hypothetical protein